MTKNMNTKEVEFLKELICLFDKYEMGYWGLSMMMVTRDDQLAAIKKHIRKRIIDVEEE